MIKIDHLSKKYNDNVVLDDISLEIKQGDVVGIIGPSGTGKSTLLRCVNRLETPEKGTVTIGDKVIGLSERKPKELLYLRQNTGMVFQRFNLFSNLTILDNVTLAPMLVKKQSRAEAEKRALALLETVGLSEKRDAYPEQLSGGQQQRVAIARALATHPKILLCDEATSALDNLTQKRVSESLDSLKCTRIVIAHRLSTIKQCDRILVLDGGKITEDGTYDELIAQNGVFAELVERQRLDT